MTFLFLGLNVSFWNFSFGLIFKRTTVANQIWERLSLKNNSTYYIQNHYSKHKYLDHNFTIFTRFYFPLDFFPFAIFLLALWSSFLVALDFFRFSRYCAEYFLSYFLRSLIFLSAFKSPVLPASRTFSLCRSFLSLAFSLLILRQYEEIFAEKS